jgi:hypothetical protein
LGTEVFRETPPHGLRKQVAEQQDSTAAHADLEESGGFAPDPDNIVPNCRDNPPARSGQLRVRTDMQDSAGAVFHRGF